MVQINLQIENNFYLCDVYSKYSHKGMPSDIPGYVTVKLASIDQNFCRLNQTLSYNSGAKETSSFQVSLLKTNANKIGTVIENRATNPRFLLKKTTFYTYREIKFSITVSNHFI